MERSDQELLHALLGEPDIAPAGDGQPFHMPEPEAFDREPDLFSLLYGAEQPRERGVPAYRPLIRRTRVKARTYVLAVGSDYHVAYTVMPVTANMVEMRLVDYEEPGYTGSPRQHAHLRNTDMAIGRKTAASYLRAARKNGIQIRKYQLG